MSKYEIESLIETMNNYDDLASKAKAKADAIRDTLKGEMLRLGAEELTAGAYILRYTSVVSNRFDSATFKRLYADLYKDFTKPVSSRRFSVSCRNKYAPRATKSPWSNPKGGIRNDTRLRKMLYKREQTGY